MPFPCPYCSLPLAAGPGRVVCPRCGESVAVPEGADGGPVADEEPATLDGAAQALKSLAILGALLALTVGSIGVYAFTRPTADRRAVAPPPVVVPTSPLAWPGVADLPADCTVAFAAHPAGAADARAKLRDAGVPDALFTTLEQFGVKFEAIDHVAGGLVAVPGGLIPRTMVVVSLREPLDLPAFRARLQAKPAKQFGAYEFAARGVPVFVRDSGPRGLIFATELPDLKPAPPRPPVPADPAGQLPPGVRDAARYVPPDAVAWAATAQADWPAVPAVALGLNLLTGKARVTADRLSRARAAWAAVPPDGPPQVRTRDAAGKWTRFTSEE